MTAYFRDLTARRGLGWLGVITFALFLFITWAWYFGAAQELLRDKGRVVKVVFPHAQQLREGDAVHVDGREEGLVTGIEDTGGGRGALVTLDVSEDAGPLYGDVQAELRWKNLLGGAFYVELDRGTPQAGDLGSRIIPAEQTVSQVELDDITSVVRGDARRGLLTMPGELSRALRDEEVPADLLDAVGAASPSLAAGANAARGLDEDRDLRRVITGSASAMSALDAPRDDLRGLVAGAAATLGTTAGRAADIRATLADGPAVTRDVQGTLARLDSTLEGADGLVAELRRSAKQIAPTLAELRPTLRTTSRLLGRARPLVRALRPSVRSLARTGVAGVPLLDELQPGIDRLDEIVFPYLAERDPETGKPTSVMIGGTAAGFGGSASQQDANGHFIRFPASSGTESVYLPCKSQVFDPTKDQLLACDGLDKALETYFEYVPALSQQPMARKGGAP